MFNFENKKSVFKNKEHQLLFEENGFVILPFYDASSIEKLLDFYKQNTESYKTGFQPTTYSQSLDYRLKASEIIKTIALPYIEKILIDYKIFMGSYIVKHYDKNSELGVHQDMTLVDESIYSGINIWSPLCNTDENNGTLYLIPKSHRIFATYRNATIPNIYDKYYNQIKKYMIPTNLKAGEAIFFDNSLLHFSPINQSNQIRIATNVFVSHKAATITICYLDTNGNQIELFEQEDDFFTTYTQFNNEENLLRPKMGKSIGFRDYDFPVLTPSMLDSIKTNQNRKSFLEQLKSILK